MLKSITKKIIDESGGGTYRFTFHCDICGSPWTSDTYSPITEPIDADEVARGRESDHDAAYERANLEAGFHFNCCSICKRVVCDECFCILPELDLCKECTDTREIEAQRQEAADSEIFRPPETQETAIGFTGLAWFRRIFTLHNTGPPRKRK